MIEVIEGNILLTEKDIIVQQVNCRGFMGAGLALSIMKRYPNVKKDYQAYRKKRLPHIGGDKDLLGDVNFVDVYDGKIIANVFGQVDTRKGPEDDAVYTNEEALLRGIRAVKEKAEALGLSVAIPTYIGSGLAGGDWDSISRGIEAIFTGSDVPVAFYHYRP